MTTIQTQPHRAQSASFSIPSIVAVICAVASFGVGPGAALLLSLAAAILGIIGVVVSLLPNVRGGLISVLSLIMGSIGVIVAIIRLIASL